ncbi:MAG: SDR family oxidoreductase [Thaumarchaeota archaeon]|nr:MAG: SDR family oxidoreductase [Nitrososphaerota archaeon]
MKDKKTVLVTGCSSGIGYATSLVLSRNNFMTYGSVRDLSKSGKIQKIIENEGLPLKIIHIDVNDNKSIEVAIQKILFESGRIDILVNNAGYGMFGPIEDITVADIKEQFETNFFGAIRLIKTIVPIMRKQGNGIIVNISSMVGRFAVPLNAAYVSSKFALEGFSESISYELEEFGIKVILVEPGVVRTDFFQNLKIKGTDSKSPYYQLMEKRIGLLKTAMENGTSSNEVANIILHALNSKDPVFRYIIGNDATNCIRMRKSLSDKEFMKWIRDGIFHSKGFTR